MTGPDFYILNLLQKLHNPPLDAVMIFLTYLGSLALPWIIAAVILTAKKASRKSGLTIALGMLMGLFVGSLILKHLFLRERPFNNPLGLISEAKLLIPPPSDRYSFPSGHSITSFAAACGIYFHNKKIGIGAFVLAFLIAFSRVYLYVHFPSDVIVGAVLGILCAVLAKKITDRLCA